MTSVLLWPDTDIDGIEPELYLKPIPHPQVMGIPPKGKEIPGERCCGAVGAWGGELWGAAVGEGGWKGGVGLSDAEVWRGRDGVMQCAGRDHGLLK